MDSDSAWDIRDEESDALIKRIIKLAESKEATEYDEIEHDLLFYNFEVLFALDAHELIGWDSCPAPEMVRKLKDRYLKAWSDYFLEGAGASKEDSAKRRQVIENTFDRFADGCDKHHSSKAK